ncbi:MAG: trypsin-like peptidase domain-containing protein [Candidatus Shapirobacteria bacterium]|nr:trypsin-like peptidase domain-containing protein [Candidatus Shapirobacteria bacterium]
MFKKVINLIFPIHPIVYILLVTILFTFLSFYFSNTSIFVYLVVFFASCLIISTPNLIDSFLINYNKRSAWFIVAASLAIFLYLSGLLPSKITDNVLVILILGFIILSFIFYLFVVPLKGIFWLIKKIPWKFVKRFTAYIERLLSPVYLFPIKLITYSVFYILIFSIKLIIELSRILMDGLKFPFKSFRNFLKSLFFLALTIYLVASIFVITDYIKTRYGYYGKFFCSAGTSEKIKKSVVRIVGGYSEGTGFFISENEVLTNFHVIADEPSPKIIFPDGTFITPSKITGDKDSDLAILFTDKNYPDLVLPLSTNIQIKDDEPLLATGFPLGTEIVGKATTLRGNFVDFRKSKNETIGYIQTNISLVEGMSGGPLTDQCGQVVGINTKGLAGLSLFISASEANEKIYNFTDQEIEKINVDPTKSPEDAVKSFYAYLKARRMKDGFDLLSKEYLQKTSFEEWTARYKDTLDVDIIKSEKFENSEDTIFLKFMTKNWVENEVAFHYYEGTWQTIFEDGKYKMLKSKIKEVANPDANWFYE